MKHLKKLIKKEELQEEYKVPVLPINIDAMNEKDMYTILREALYEFPVLEIKVNMPEWITILNPNHILKKEYIDSSLNLFVTQ